MIQKIILSLFLISVITQSSYTQKIELDFGAGVHFSKIEFHHNYEVETDYDQKYQTYASTNYKIGISAPLSSNRWYLESEIGFLKTNSFYFVRYTYDEGFGEQLGGGFTYLTNQKMYLSIAPEYRINFRPFALKINGGFLLSSDISNTMSSSNTVLLPTSIPLGLKFGVGIQYMSKKIGVEFGISNIKLGQSELQNHWHPKISYDLILLGFGVIYSL